MITLKVDIDNVIRDMGAEMVKIYNHKFGTSLTKEDIKDYDVAVAFPLLKENGINAQKWFFEESFWFMYTLPEPMKDSIEGLELAKKYGFKIILVTYQPNNKSKEETVNWLSDNEVPYDALVFLNKDDKTIIHADYIIDDNPKFLDEDKDSIKVCIDWAYNRGKEYDYRCKSIKEFIETLQKDGKTNIK